MTVVVICAMGVVLSSTPGLQPPACLSVSAIDYSQNIITLQEEDEPVTIVYPVYSAFLRLMMYGDALMLLLCVI